MGAPVRRCAWTAYGSRVQELLEAVRRTIREELTGVSFTKTTTQPEQAGAVDEDVLGFLRALQEGDDTI